MGRRWASLTLARVMRIPKFCHTDHCLAPLRVSPGSVRPRNPPSSVIISCSASTTALHTVVLTVGSCSAASLAFAASATCASCAGLGSLSVCPVLFRRIAIQNGLASTC